MSVKIVRDVDADVLLLGPALWVRKGLAWFLHDTDLFNVWVLICVC